MEMESSLQNPLAFIEKKISDLSKAELAPAQPLSVQILNEEPYHPAASRILNLDSSHSNCILKDDFHKKDHRHLYEWRGSHPREGGSSFQVFAPNAREVHLVLTAFGREEHVIPMQRSVFGTWEVFSREAHLGRTYRYRIQDSWHQWSSRTDPFGVSLMENGGVCESVVSSLSSYHWNDGGWMDSRKYSDPTKRPLSIYELNVESWKKHEGRTLSFRELAHQIVDYQRRLGFTHVELYGVIDNRHDYSWGYQPNHFLAVNRRMGNADDFKYLVDLCHQNGIGVILDWIPAHYKQDHAGDVSETLHYYDGTDHFGAEHSEWGTAYFDFGKEETRRLLLASALYWLEMTHVDGLRVDAVGPMVKRFGDIKWFAVDFLKELNCVAHEHYPGILMIAEETSGFSKVTRPVWEGGLGFDVKAGIHTQKRVRHYFKTPYDERGWDEHHFGKMLANLDEAGKEERWMLAHSHDDAASGGMDHQHGTLYRSMPTGDDWRRFADMRLFHAWNLLTPGAGHMIHMGDELGQKEAWNGRLHTREGAVEWHLLDSFLHHSLQTYVGDLNRLYRSKPAFWKHADFGYRPISHYGQNKVIGFHRLDHEGGRLALFFNFSPMGYSEYDFPLPSLHEDGDLGWIRGAREIFNSDGVQYGGTGCFRNRWLSILRNEAGAPTHFRFAFPPLSLLVFEEVWELS